MLCSSRSVSSYESVHHRSRLVRICQNMTEHHPVLVQKLCHQAPDSVSFNFFYSEVSMFISSFHVRNSLVIIHLFPGVVVGLCYF